MQSLHTAAMVKQKTVGCRAHTAIVRRDKYSICKIVSSSLQGVQYYSPSRMRFEQATKES
jgi:hypothetical protein